ncbi:MAG: 3-deoxy-manno-octulosonate cytidylyltransferase [Acidobacteriota bacterium]
MDRGRVIAVIPARYGSTRFPGKPLTPLSGQPMIAHVVARALEAGCFAEVVVATDDDRIAAAARATGARAVITGEAPTGTDRVAAAAREVAADVVINLQGDEPAVPPENLRRLAHWLLDHPEAPAATLALPCLPADFDNPTVVKVVSDLAGRALYFSRAPIPFPRNPLSGAARKHVGLYGFRSAALFTFASWPECELERIEGLEQLRALAHGMAIQVLDAAGDSVAVDVPADVPRAEAALAAMARAGSGARGQGARR